MLRPLNLAKTRSKRPLGFIGVLVRILQWSIVLAAIYLISEALLM